MEIIFTALLDFAILYVMRYGKDIRRASLCDL